LTSRRSMKSFCSGTSSLPNPKANQVLADHGGPPTFRGEHHGTFTLWDPGNSVFRPSFRTR
jgi:hypothetical protein